MKKRFLYFIAEGMRNKISINRFELSSYLKPFTLFCRLAVPFAINTTTIIERVIGVHDGYTLTRPTDDESLKVLLSKPLHLG